MPKVTSALAPLGRYFFARAAVGAGIEAGIIDPLHAGMLLQMPGHGQRILGVALHAQMQRFNALQNQKSELKGESAAPVSRNP